MPYISGGAAAQTASKRVGVDEEYDDTVVQWCHGAPGFLILFSTLLRRAAVSRTTCLLSTAQQESIVAATTRAAQLVYTRGLLRKGTGLCHGVAGSVYALLAVSAALDAQSLYSYSNGTRDGYGSGHSISETLSRSLSVSHRIPPEIEHAYWLVRALHLADLATGYRQLTLEGKMATPDHPYSLYEGVAGMCCAWAELLVRLSGGKDKDGIVNGNGNGSGSGTRRGGMPGFDDLVLLG